MYLNSCHGYQIPGQGQLTCYCTECQDVIHEEGDRDFAQAAIQVYDCALLYTVVGLFVKSYGNPPNGSRGGADVRLATLSFADRLLGFSSISSSVG